MKRTMRLALLGVIVMSALSRGPVVDASTPLAVSGIKALLGSSTSSTVQVFRVFELSLAAASPGMVPYADGPDLKATFTGVSGAANGKSLAVRGFWDGGNVWKIRFAPTAVGEWAYTTTSSDPGLNSQSGRLTAVSSSPAELAANPLLHGFLEADGHAWQLSDGTPFLPVGDTLWSFSEDVTIGEWERWMKARQRQGFNTFLGSVWLAMFERPEATLPAFPDLDPRTEALNVEFFQRLDEMVAFANDHGIMVGLAIGGFPDNTDWFERFESRERNDRWFTYVVARYSAYNVRWVLYGEANEADPPWGTSWEEEVEHGAHLVKDEDPYDHPIGSHHNHVDTSSAGNPDIDYLEVQSERTNDQYEVAFSLRDYLKPIWFEEYWYEPEGYDGDVDLGIRNTHRNFVAALAFPTMGSLMRSDYWERDVNQVETDPGAVRMCYFGKFYARLDMRSFSPASHLVDRGQAGRFGKDYALFLEGGGRVMLDLSGESASYTLRLLDIHSGQVQSLGSVDGGGVRTIDTGTGRDAALILQSAQGGALPEEQVYRLFLPSIFHNAVPGVDTGISSCNF